MKVLIKHKDIVNACKTIGEQISEKYKGREIIVVFVLKGAAPFHSELIKHINLPMQTDYIQVKSYQGTESSGTIVFKKDLDINIENKDVIVVEDIVDTGNTLLWIKNTLEKRNPKSLTFVSMLDKPSRRKVEFKPDYIGFTIGDVFVYGFGLDLDEKCRNLKDVYIK